MRCERCDAEQLETALRAQGRSGDHICRDGRIQCPSRKHVDAAKRQPFECPKLFQREPREWQQARAIAFRILSRYEPSPFSKIDVLRLCEHQLDSSGGGEQVNGQDAS
jgi:hypothetical protein